VKVWINFAKTRDFKKAGHTANKIGASVFNEGCLYLRQLKDSVNTIRDAFEPNPSWCTVASPFDVMMSTHFDAMMRNIDSAQYALVALVNQCHALGNLSYLLNPPEEHAKTRKPLLVFMQDGTGRIV
jgi:hypothetical protein